MQNNKTIEKLEIIEILRGLAALAVTWFHLTEYGKAEYLNGWLSTFSKYGWLGVEVFFVISGFIIPYSLWRSNFELKRHWNKFLLKRLIRIYPAYLISISIIVLLGFMSAFASNFQNVDPNINISNILLHIFFLNDIFSGEAALSPVFWTLAIEFQYYLLIVLLYPLLTSSRLSHKILILLILCALAFIIPQKNLIFSWLLLFNFGILAFQFIAKKISLTQYFIMIFIAAILSYYNKEILITVIGLLTSFSIAFVQAPKIVIFVFLGKISYSLYLLHFIVGIRIMNFLARFGQGSYMRILSLVFALCLSFLAAYLMYQYVEKPTQKYFKNIKYTN